MAENHHKALSKVINSIVGKKIAMVVLDKDALGNFAVGFTLSDGRTVWVENKPDGDAVGWLKVEKK